MLQVFWSDMPDLAVVSKLLEPVGEVILLGDRSLRLSPFDVQYPTMYFNRGGIIDIVIAGTDLFYQDNCLMALEQWLGERFTR